MYVWYPIGPSLAAHRVISLWISASRSPAGAVVGRRILPAWPSLSLVPNPNVCQSRKSGFLGRIAGGCLHCCSCLHTQLQCGAGQVPSTQLSHTAAAPGAVIFWVGVCQRYRCGVTKHRYVPVCGNNYPSLCAGERLNVCACVYKIGHV